ncbi:MAG: DUF2721 domain-containing protein [Leptolyngbyaceae cyanobacterium bins.59]|nr:DUF2721 domain-containing protein [Leptolyngbyaceae cyanobacterium bins.59]
MNDPLSTAITATQAIQAILAPAVMVSATALFLLGLNARYVAVLAKIRDLNAEKRKLTEALTVCLANPPKQELGSEPIRCNLERSRVLNVNQQLSRLLKATWCIRNSILCHLLAAIFFVLTSCSIALDFLLEVSLNSAISLYLFMIGILLLLSGITFLGIDIFISYPVIMIEVSEDDWEKKGKPMSLL